MMSRSEILNTADIYVTKDRQADHGDLENNFEAIAQLWSIYLNKMITRADVALMMVLLKVARAKGSPGHSDNWVDIAGYAACGGELALSE